MGEAKEMPDYIGMAAEAMRRRKILEAGGYAEARGIVPQLPFTDCIYLLCFELKHADQRMHALETWRVSSAEKIRSLTFWLYALGVVVFIEGSYITWILEHGAAK